MHRAPAASVQRLTSLKAQIQHPPTALITRSPARQPAASRATRPLTSSTRNMAPAKQEPPSATPPTAPSAFLDAIAHRRSVYALEATSPLASDALAALLRRAALHVPSAFNSQTTRMALLVGGRHAAFWDAMDGAIEAAYGASDPAKVERTRKRLPGFRAAHGTVLFFEAAGAVAALRDKAAAYADLVPGWSEHASGMMQLAVWTAFEAAGLGANLQHYNYIPGADDAVRKTFALPGDWELKAQLVFGGVKEGAWPAEGKDKMDPEETVRVFAE